MLNIAKPTTDTTTVAACACGVFEETLPLRCAYRYCHYASRTRCPTYSLQGPARLGLRQVVSRTYDVFGRIRDDEANHATSMQACQDAEVRARPNPEPRTPDP